MKVLTLFITCLIMSCTVQHSSNATLESYMSRYREYQYEQQALDWRVETLYHAIELDSALSEGDRLELMRHIELSERW